MVQTNNLSELAHMDTNPPYTRPPFEHVLAAWKALLSARALPTDLLWLYEENLCFESDPGAPQGYRLGFQIAYTPAPPEAESISYDYFCESDAPIVIYRLGTCRGRSLCLWLCDRWFERKQEADGYVRHDEWRMSFRPGLDLQVEEIKDAQRWKRRMLRNRPLHDLDFCMTLRAVHETLAHGRVLSTYERSALSVLHLWRRVFRMGSDR